MKISSARLTILMVLLLQSHDCSYKLASPLWLQNPTNLLPHSPDLWLQLKLADVICAWSWRLCRINHAILSVHVKESHFVTLWQLSLQSLSHSVRSDVACDNPSLTFANDKLAEFDQRRLVRNIKIDRQTDILECRYPLHPWGFLLWPQYSEWHVRLSYTR